MGTVNELKIFDVIMPWGKFRGKLIQELPSGYLLWLAESCKNETICVAADEECRERTDSNTHWYEDN